MMIPPEVLIFLNCFCYHGVFVIPDEFDNCSFYLCEELSWNLMGIALNLQITFGHFYYVNPADP